MIDIARLSLAAILLATGLSKLLGPREVLLSTGHMNWVAEMPMPRVRAIAVLELLAVTGLLLPPLLDTAEFVVTLAAIGVVGLMIGAAATHARLGEREKLPLNAAIALIAVLVAVGS